MAARSPRRIRLHGVPTGAHIRPEGLQELADRRRQDELDAAHAQGLEEGKAIAIESGTAALETTLSRIDATAERAQEELALQAVELAVEIARTLLKVRIEAGDYDLERIVRSALDDAGVGRASCVVHLNPEDHGMLEGALFRAGTQLEVDPNMVRGDVHLSTPRGLLVRDLDTALTSIREQLLEELA